MRRENPIVAVLREIAAGERRVALTPPDVHRLAARKPVLIERDAGIEAGYTNEDYVAAGAILSNRAHLIEQADVLLAVRTPKDAERAKSDSLLISLGSNDDAPTARLRSLGIHHLVLDRIPPRHSNSVYGCPAISGRDCGLRRRPRGRAPCQCPPADAHDTVRRPQAGQDDRGWGRCRWASRDRNLKTPGCGRPCL